MKSRFLQRYGWHSAVWGMMLVAFVLVTWPNVHAYLALVSMMFDLGNMTQATWSVLHGAPLLYSTPSFREASRLAGHAEVIYVLFAPLLKIWPSPVALIVAQSLLYVSGGWAFFRLGRRLLGSEAWGALGAFLYLFYPVAQTAAIFEFHGDTIGMPLLAWALEALEARRWRRYGVLVALALLSKVYVCLVVGLLGIVLWLKGEKKVALWTVLAAVFWGSVVVLGFWHWFSPQWSGLGYLKLRYVESVPRAPDQLFWVWVTRGITVLVVFGPLAWNLKGIWPWVWPGLILAVLSLGTGNQGNVAYYSQHYALSVSFLVWSILRSWRVLLRWGKSRILHFRIWGTTLTLIGVNLAAVFPFLVLPHFRVFWTKDWQQVKRGQWALHQISRIIPPEAPVLATPSWAVHLSLRSQVYPTLGTQFSIGEWLDLRPAFPRVRYALVDGFFEYGDRAYPLLERETLKMLLEEPSFVYVNQWDGVILFQKGGQQIGQEEGGPCDPPVWAIPEKTGQGLSLAGVSIEVLGGSDGTLTLKGCYRWMRQTEAVGEGYAVSEVEGLPLSRGLHVETWALYPPENWQGKEKTEQVVWTVLRREGCYPLAVGWYDPTVPDWAASQEALIGHKIYLGTLCVHGDGVEWFPHPRP